MKKLPVVSAALMIIVAALSGPAAAYQTGDMIFRAGAAVVDPHVDSGKLEKDGAVMLSSSGKATTVDVDSSTKPGLSATYMVDDNIGLELLVAAPFRHTIKTKGGLEATIGHLGETKQLPPTLTLQYYPMGDDSKFQPYVGFGLNYTKFFSEKFKGSNKTTFKNLELEDSWGAALQIGADFRIDDNWSINAAAWYVDLNTKATFKNTAGEKYKIDVDLDPMVYMIGVAYKL